MKTWYFIIDVAKCENCNNCFLACKDEHVGNTWPGYSSPMPSQGPAWIKIDFNERGQHPFIDVAYLPQPCMHCDDPPCRGTKRADGIVLIDQQSKETMPCPYGAINNGQKCTFCSHLLDEGWTTTRCVQACPTGALSIHRLDDGELKRLIEENNLETLHPEWNTKPRVYYKNLYRFTRCFIGGSVATRVNATEDCLEGAHVTLSTAGKTIGETTTDNYGDFKFDNLPENSGSYTLTITGAGKETKAIDVQLGKSIFVGVVYI